ncbi:hypothetical protein BU14_0294s0014 [Porphyra umbilicalis]|uniref:Uncharacterized protein n=1 Tax=Porphyra umbilicalis TaxID=2786 RepID=A0A1X6P121_PORUM|nr:hypothetical protein BU14_0294s0014 [Porphyra umbilicalis]|eukprot:OSX74323.1 hypothetical protein BU14_0294s0014 [Porphyra umbilicalis]
MGHMLWGLTDGSDAGRCPISASCRLSTFLRLSRNVSFHQDRTVAVVGGQWELAVWALANFSDRHHADMTIFGGELYTTCTMCKRLVPYSSEPGEDSGIVYCRGAHCLAEDVPLHVGRSIAVTTMTECFNGFRRLAGGVCGYPPLRGAPVSLQLPVLHCTGNYAKRVVLFILACQPAGLQDKARRVLLAMSGKGSMGSLYLREFRELVAAAVVHPAVFSNSLDPAFSILLQLTQLMNAAWRGALTGPGAADVKPLDPVTKDAKVSTLYLHAPIVHVRGQSGAARAEVAFVSDDNMEGHIRGVGRYLDNHSNNASPAEPLSNMAAVQKATIGFSTPRSHPSSLVFTKVVRVCRCWKAFGRDGPADVEAVCALARDDAALELEEIRGGDELRITLAPLRAAVDANGAARFRPDGTRVPGKMEALRRGLRVRQREFCVCVCGRLQGRPKSATVELAAARRAAAMRAAVAAAATGTEGADGKSAYAKGEGGRTAGASSGAGVAAALAPAASADGGGASGAGTDQVPTPAPSLPQGSTTASSAATAPVDNTSQSRRRALLASLPSFFPPPALLPLVFLDPAVYSACDAEARLPGAAARVSVEVDRQLLEQVAILRLFRQRTKTYEFSKWATSGTVNEVDICEAAVALLRRLKGVRAAREEWGEAGGHPARCTGLYRCGATGVGPVHEHCTGLY